MKKKLTILTSRHIGRIMQILRLMKVDEKQFSGQLQSIRREIWFVHDDLIENILNASTKDLKLLRKEVKENEYQHF